MTDREAMKLALDALETLDEYEQHEFRATTGQAIVALQSALARPQGEPGEMPEPVAEIKRGLLRWHIASPNSDPAAPFLDNDTRPLYTADQLRAAVAAERERCAKLCENVDLSALVEHPGWMIYAGRLCAGLAALIRVA